MKMWIVSQWFAPKIKEIKEKIHSVYFMECNFNCSFCSQSHREKFVELTEYDEYSFREKVKTLILESKYFKLTGGEPAVNGDIKEIVEIINQCGGFVFFDTNGSNYELVRTMIQKKQIKVLGVSIKGLTSEEAQMKSGVKNKKLCWENVFLTCNCAFGHATVILTYVVDSLTKTEDVLMFCHKIVNQEINVDYFKLNNLYGRHLPDPTICPMETKELVALATKIVETFDSLKNRIIVIPGFDAVTNSDSILYF